VREKQKRRLGQANARRRSVVAAIGEPENRRKTGLRSPRQGEAAGAEHLPIHSVSRVLIETGAHMVRSADECRAV
jgi:hypothetical protein